jgi:hypothetical protein
MKWALLFGVLLLVMVSNSYRLAITMPSLDTAQHPWRDDWQATSASTGTVHHPSNEAAADTADAPTVSVAASASSTALDAHSQSSAPRKVHANHSHAAITTTLSNTNADAATTTTTEAEPAFAGERERMADAIGAAGAPAFSGTYTSSSLGFLYTMREAPVWKTDFPKWLAQTEITKPPRTPGAFLHIGKTGGSTLSHLLRHGCHSWAPKPCQIPANETYISQLSTYYHVPDFKKLNKTAYSFYTISLRDPLERTLSAFTYSHPANQRARGRRRISKPDLDFFYALLSRPRQLCGGN